MLEILNLYLSALRNVFSGEGIRMEACWMLESLIQKGDPRCGAFLGSLIDELPGGRTSARAGLVAKVEELAFYTPRLNSERAAWADLKGLASTLHELSGLAEEIGNAGMAYNFAEGSYHLLDICDEPALDVAKRLRRLSDPNNAVQHRGAIWRLATEELRHAIACGSGWLTALEAVDLALMCHVPHPELQLHLFEKFHAQVLGARDTPIEPILTQVVFEAPVGTAAHAVRSRVLDKLLEGKFGANAEGTPPAAVEEIAAPIVQCEAGDLRLQFLPRGQGAPQIDPADLRYRDERLSHTVPVGRSLIADPLRTDALLLDMTHEVGHAVVLQGAIGMREALYRTVATYCEIMLVGLADPDREDMPLEEMKAVGDLPAAAEARALAEAQLRAVQKAAVERAVWRSWLEGVSLYLELLADPKDDPSEISLVHECIRGMIDFSVPPQPGEDREVVLKRYVADIVEQFDDFMSNAIKKQSRLNHLAYVHNSGAGEEARDVYVLGYLLVRSVVSTWERTLGRRLPAGIAAKLLLNATQAGTHDALPDPLAAPLDHLRDAQDRYMTWVAGLASLDKEALEAFFTPVGIDQRRPPTVWQAGRPHCASVVGDGERALKEAAREKTRRQMLGLTDLNADTSGERIRDSRTILENLFAQQLERNGFLAIGSDRPRLMFMQHNDRVCLAIRTYGGDEEKAATQRAQGRMTGTYDARYYSISIPLEGGPAERDELRAAFGTAGTGRAFATRMIDLRGHPDAPTDVRGGSFICAFLPSGFDLVLQGQTLAPITKTHPEFVALLKSRLFPPFSFVSQEDTIASLEFLKARAMRASPNVPITDVPSGEVLASWAQDTALLAAGLAFGAAFADAYHCAMADVNFRSAMANVLHASGRGLELTGDRSPRQNALRGHVLTGLIFDAEHPSTVTRFGANK